MKVFNNMDKKLKAFFEAKRASVRTTIEMDERILNDAIEIQKKTMTTKTAQPEPIRWRTIMTGKLTRFATAAVVIFGIGWMIFVNFEKYP
jgi:hypothetical protein